MGSSIEGKRSASLAEQLAGWRHIDDIESTSGTIGVLWRKVDGEDHFSLFLSPKGGGTPQLVNFNYEEIQQVRREEHAYSFVAPKVGHVAAIEALGISEP